MDIDNIRLNYGPINDLANRAVVSYVYDLPFGRGKKFLGGADGSAQPCGWRVAIERNHYLP